MNDVVINRKKLGKYLGEHVKTVKDRGYTIEEIKQIIDACNLKYKIVVTMMCSSGCRIGAIPSIMIKNLKYHEKYQLYQITFYENTKEEYYSFVSPECSNYIREYLDFRERCGEKLEPNSPLIRDDFVVDDLLRVENPKFLSLDSYHKYLQYILIKVGIRDTTTELSKRKRKEISQNHGFRKFTMTTMSNAKINVEIRELLLGHSIGLGDSYYRPTEKEMLLEYLKVVNDLTVDESHRLQKQLQIVEDQKNYQTYVIDTKLKETEKENEQMKQLMKNLTLQIEQLTNEANKNKQDYLSIAKQVHRLHYIKRNVNPDTKRKWIRGTDEDRSKIVYEFLNEDMELRKKQIREQLYKNKNRKIDK